MDQWDELGGQVRNNKSLILTDMTYQTRSSSRIIHDIEAGLNNLGLSFIKVYQLPYESLEKPEEFLRLATEALTFLRTNATILTSVTVHIWISFASLFRGQSRTLYQMLVLSPSWRTSSVKLAKMHHFRYLSTF